MADKTYNPGILRVLVKNKLTLAGLVVIALALFFCIFGYLVVPDNTPDANLQTVEIQSRPPGYTQLFFRQPANNITPRRKVHEIFFGKPALYRYTPVSNYRVGADSLFINKFVDEDTSVSVSYAIRSFTLGAGKNVRNLFLVKKYWLGTDAFGRDILSRLLIGTRVSIMVGFIAVLISLTLGIVLGAVAGYYRGKTDAAIMWLVNVTWSIPTMLLVFAVTLTIGKGFWQIFIAVGLTLWISVARLVRGQVMAVKEAEYVQAAKALGFKDSRIIFRHILPNIIGPILVIAAGNFASAIIIEAGLSFLGIGVQPPAPSWGLMIKENYNLIITHNAVQALIPGFAIMLLVLAFNVVGNGLRDAADVRGREL